ncbi:MAG TPA: hypothetical protein VL501_10020, partial [Pyrinomonadaceae bacterium]|nr:hypothetical protein [Pyrinomonadaceae bacterium]
MRSNATTPEDYIASLADDRREIVSEIRDAINDNIPPGYTESMYSGMINWVVPHSTYPPGYHVDPRLPLGLL